MIKVLIADDHAVVRRGLRQILSEENDMRVFGEAKNAHEVLELLKQEPWDFVILDINMPGRGGLETLQEIRQSFPKLPVLILSMHSENQFAVRALKIGASGYLTKDSAPELLIEAIRKIISGGKYVSASLAEKLVTDLQTEGPQFPHETLSDREFQIFRMIASGKTVSEIGRELNLSVKTISTYRSRILEKMGMRTNAELIHYAAMNRILDPVV